MSPDPLRPPGPAIQHRRQDEHDRRAQDADELQDAEDARALVVLGGDHRGPGGVREHHHGEADIVDEQPAEQIGQAHRPWRVEEHVDPGHQHRRAGRQPQPITAQSGPGAVHQHAEHRIDGHVDQPHGHEDEADRAQSQAQVTGVISRQIDRQADRQGPGRDPRHGEGDPRRQRPAPTIARSSRVAGHAYGTPPGHRLALGLKETLAAAPAQAISLARPIRRPSCGRISGSVRRRRDRPSGRPRRRCGPTPRAPPRPTVPLRRGRRPRSRRCGPWRRRRRRR